LIKQLFLLDQLQSFSLMNSSLMQQELIQVRNG
jgi:hypothetical protein